QGAQPAEPQTNNDCRASYGLLYSCSAAWTTIASMVKLTVFLLLLTPAFAQKKPITLESLNAAAKGSGGGRGAGTWAPDGKTFVYREGAKLMIYDPAAKTARELVSTETIDAAAVNPPEDEGPLDWQNRRARTGELEWSRDGKALLYASKGDVFLIHVD